MSHATFTGGDLAALADEPTLDELLLNSFQGYSNEIRQLIVGSQQWLGARTDFYVLTPKDIPKILDHFNRLSPADIVLRFGQFRTAQHIESYIKKLDFASDALLGIQQGDVLVGFCHMAVYPERGFFSAEIGISMLPEARGKKFASKLMALCFAEAAKLGVATLYVHYLSRNTAMAALCRKFGAAIESEAGEATATLQVHEQSCFAVPALQRKAEPAPVLELSTEQASTWWNPLTWFHSNASAHAVS